MSQEKKRSAAVLETTEPVVKKAKVATSFPTICHLFHIICLTDSLLDSVEHIYCDASRDSVSDLLELHAAALLHDRANESSCDLLHEVSFVLALSNAMDDYPEDVGQIPELEVQISDLGKANGYYFPKVLQIISKDERKYWTRLTFDEFRQPPNLVFRITNLIAEL